jgi:hypothetical protein
MDLFSDLSFLEGEHSQPAGISPPFSLVALR